jgi:hypothetical protein
MKKRHLRIALVIFTSLTLSACVDREWYKQGMDYDQRTQDYMECDYEAAKTGGYDGIDRAIRSGEVMRKCMQLKGYHQRTRQYD